MISGDSIMKSILSKKDGLWRRLWLSCGWSEEFLMTHLGNDWLFTAWTWGIANLGMMLFVDFYDVISSHFFSFCSFTFHHSSLPHF